MAAAREAGADVDQDEVRAALPLVGKSHLTARRHGVFGSPTLRWPSGAAVYVRLDDLPSQGRAAAVFETVRAFAEDRPELTELKRPG